MSTEELPPRESMEFDVVIVGAGPSGLAAAIRLKQLNADLTIVVVEKGSEVGAHILSGAVIDPVALDKLIPDWREDADCPLKTQVKDRQVLLDDRGQRDSAAELHDAAADEQSSLLYRLARQCLPLAGAQGRGARGRDLSGLCRGRSALRRARARCAASPPATWASPRTARTKPPIRAAWNCCGKYTLFAEGRARQPDQAADREIRARRQQRAAEIRHRPEGSLAGRSGQAPEGPDPAFVRLAAEQQHRRRLVPLSLRRQSGRGRLRRASQLRRSLSVAVRRIPALQDPSVDQSAVRRRQAARLWRARHHRGRLSVGAAAHLRRRRADRLRGGFCQCAAHQGRAQRDRQRHAGRRTRRRRARRRPRQ